jgi:hypothetical protein
MSRLFRFAHALTTFPVNVWGVGYRLVDGPVGEVAAAATAREMGEAS